MLSRIVEDVGPFFGLAGLLLLATLAIMAISHERDLRRLRKWAGLGRRSVWWWSGRR